MKTVIWIVFVTIYLKIIKAAEYCSGLPLSGITIKPTCFRSGTSSLNCWEPVKEGTIARLSCSSGYYNTIGEDRDTIFCNAGRWSGRPFECDPICGLRDPHFMQRVLWHALIYVKSDQDSHVKCGGTIINVKLIITAAHCVWNEAQGKAVDESDVEVQLGNIDLGGYYSGRMEVSEIHFPEAFKSSTSSNQGDIAIIVLKGFIAYRYRTAYNVGKIPICIEWLDDVKKKKIKGLIPTGQKTEYSTDLAYSECDYNSKFHNDSVIELSCKTTFDNERACFADKGGGFVIAKNIDGNEVYFLRGIVTNVFPDTTICPNNYSVTITNIQHYSAMISEHMKKYTVDRDLERSESFPCEVPYIPKLKIVLEENYNKKKNLSDGDYVNGLNKIIYSCEENYELIGTRTNYCYYDRWYKAGKWAENHPICIAMTAETTPAPSDYTCSKPIINNAALFDWTWKKITENFVEEGNRVRYRCNKNFHLIGKTENRCERGKWIWDHPTCLSIHVNPPSEEKCDVPVLPNAIIILEGSKKKNLSVGNYVESENGISYSCTDGHLLHGGSVNYCSEGKWVSEHPSCIKFIVAIPTKDDCELPHIPNGATILDAIIKANESSPSFVRNYENISYKCKKNHVLEGESTNKCYYNGVWKNEHPRCIKITENDCEVPAIPNLVIVLEGEIQKTLAFGSYVKDQNIITYSCKEHHILQGKNTNRCINGGWIDGHPICIKYCPSSTLKGVTFSAICEYYNERISCDQHLRVGSIAKIFCQYGYKKPDKIVPEALICEESGHWDYDPYRCEPICGTERSEIVPYIKGGEKVNITAVPWHAAVYSFARDRYTQICGGTIISPRVVVSAAHCFWHGPDIPADHSKILVGVGKYYRDYFAEEPLAPQFFNVSEIYIPEGFQGPSQAYHDDIAILVLIGYIEYKSYIKPICIQELTLEEKAIHSGLIGRVAGWGRTRLDVPSEELQMLEISTLSYTDCVNAVDPRFRSQIAADKFCISSPEIESVCPGDSGGGFVIPQVINEVKTYFLWGIVSNGLSDRHDCEGVNLTSLTNIQHYYDKILYYQKTHGVK